MHHEWDDVTWRPTPDILTERGEATVAIHGQHFLLSAQRSKGPDGSGTCELYLGSKRGDKSADQWGTDVTMPICVGPLVGQDWLELGPEESAKAMRSFVERAFSGQWFLNMVDEPEEDVA